ncbi:MAG TPA: hypothetical protein VHZ07_16325 [Bryobacteraceae bacterium]|jgi:hypothetical protein|nr:hypothetical protein [Bryobacteraceae bacterium]
MEADLGIPDLKRKLLADVQVLFRPNGSTWKSPILQVLEALRQSGVQAVLFGGTLRSLLVSRIFEGRFGRPRDIDVVVSGAGLSELEERFRSILARRTRFGGLQLRNGDWRFDVWPLNETWALKKDRIASASFEDLPSTTTFNLEAAAVEAWSRAGRPRALFSGNDQFFKGLLSRTLELNRTDSPFPELTVVRAVVMATELRFKIGPLLAEYIADVGSNLTEEAIAQIQAKHYGQPRLSNRTLKHSINLISWRSSEHVAINLPPGGQLQLWDTEHD